MKQKPSAFQIFRIFHPQFSKAFSLIELIIVIGILGILAVIAIPAYQNYREAPYDAWAKSELAEQSRYLKLAHSADGGYHQYLWSMDYRPSRPLLGNAGFKDGYGAVNSCCARYDSGQLFNYYKKISHSADDYSICKRMTNSDTPASCPDQKGRITIGTNIAGNGIQKGACTYEFEEIKCECDKFLILAVTAHGESYSSATTAQSAVDDDGARVFLLNHEGQLCTADKKNTAAQRLF